MEKLKMESIDLTQKNIEKIGKLFPNVITEMRDENGNFKKGINIELLKQELSGDVVDGEECYDFTWVGKKAAIVEGNTPIRKTLRPCIEESKDWEDTENLYIEGDNLDVLKLLQESYLNSVKMIYIDPPYNTGNDFIYKDNFVIDKDEYEEEIGLFDEDENRLFKNTETNGRFHSDWCSMIYPRLKLASNLLSEDGVVFISIDDNEIDNLIKMCNEIFGEDNALPIIIRRAKIGGGSDNKQFAKEADFVVTYAKSINYLNKFYLPHSDDDIKRYSQEDEIGRFFWDTYSRSGLLIGDTESDSLYYEVTFPDGTTRSDRWRRSKERLEKDIETGEAKYTKTSNGWNIHFKQRLNSEGKRPRQIIYDNMGNTLGKNDLKLLGLDKYFEYPKPLALVEFLTQVSLTKGATILDFFSGSSTTAHAVMSLNSRDCGGRKFIMVQLPEPTSETSEAYKAGYKNISEIGKERIRRVGEKIKEGNKDKENIHNLDIGFRVLKVDSTNMKDVYYAANEYSQAILAGLESNIKEDRTDLDLLYGVLLDWGLPLSLSHKTEEIEGVFVHTVDEGSLVACFAEEVSETVVREIAKRQPLRVVFRDSSFANSPDKINVEEIFKLHAPNTSVKVI